MTLHVDMSVQQFKTIYRNEYVVLSTSQKSVLMELVKRPEFAEYWHPAIANRFDGFLGKLFDTRFGTIALALGVHFPPIGHVIKREINC